MFTIDSEARISVYPKEAMVVDQSNGKCPFWTQGQLGEIIQEHPGEWAVRLWNQLPSVTPIHTPPGEPTAKFRNKQTASERIWTKLCELYPDAILESDMPKKAEHHAKINKSRNRSKPTRTHTDRKNTARPRPMAGSRGNRKSAWAEELTEALRKQFNPGDSFELQDVYKLIPQFQRRHKENHHIAARLRTTLAQDLRGAGIVKTTAKGKYRMA